MHNEYQPHEYAISWTTSRQVDGAFPHVLNGGNFFLASHGVRIQAAANSLIVWRPRLMHGTSLGYQTPRKPSTDFFQQGLAFVTSARLPGAWEAYRAKKISQEEAEAQLLEPHDSSDNFFHGPMPSSSQRAQPELNEPVRSCLTPDQLADILNCRYPIHLKILNADGSEQPSYLLVTKRTLKR